MLRVFVVNTVVSYVMIIVNDYRGANRYETKLKT